MMRLLSWHFFCTLGEAAWRVIYTKRIPRSIRVGVLLVINRASASASEMQFRQVDIVLSAFLHIYIDP
jgi:hypothetical protein